MPMSKQRRQPSTKRHAKELKKSKPGFKAGNSFWKLRTSFGTNALFASPDKLLAAAMEYFEANDANPWVTEDGRKLRRPYTLAAMSIFMGAHSEYWRKFKNTDIAQSDEFQSVIGIIEDVIRTQKFDGASVGEFHANIISRDLGLAEKLDANVNTRKEVGDLFPDEAEFRKKQGKS